MTINDDQIDLRPYIVMILKYKWLIIILSLVLIAAAVLYTRSQSDQYISSATLLLTRSRPVLSLAQQFPTVNEPIDSRSRMDAILSIAESDDLIQQTIDVLGNALPDTFKSLNAIKPRLKLENKGDSITVSATAEDPKVAADIANSWARHIVETINSAYSSEQPLIEIQQQLITAKEDYDSAQSELEAFINQNPRYSLEQQYDELQVIYGLVKSDSAVTMDQLVKRKQAMQELAFQAEALKKQLEVGTKSKAGNQGDALAVILARMKALGIQRTASTSDLDLSALTSSSASRSSASKNAPISIISQPVDVVLNLQVNGTDGTPDQTSDYVADIDSLIKLLEDEKARTETAIQSLTEEVIGEGSRLAMDGTAARLQELETQIEKTKSKEQELTSNRDLTWDAYQALAQKETEIKNTALTGNQINLASPAIPPHLPESRGTIQKALIAGILGILLGFGWAIIREWWKTIPQTKSG